jgi:hypothetical protein
LCLATERYIFAQVEAQVLKARQQRNVVPLSPFTPKGTRVETSVENSEMLTRQKLAGLQSGVAGPSVSIFGISGEHIQANNKGVVFHP